MISRDGILVSILLLMVAPTTMMAQEGTPCTWDTCALRLEPGLFGDRLTRGVEAEEVAGVSFFPPELPLFEERSSVAASQYREFRSKQISGTAMMLVGTAVIVGGAVASNKGEDGLAAGLHVGGGVLNLIGILRISAGRKDLSRAIWSYNRTLAYPVVCPQ